MKLLELETPYVEQVRVLFEVLKGILTETNIYFNSNTTDKNQETNCIKINSFNIAKTILVDVKLDGENFDKFICKKKQICIGVNLVKFHKVIKTINNGDKLHLSLDKENKNNLEVKFISPKNRKNSLFGFKLIELDAENAKLPEISYDAVITMESYEFNRLCREMQDIGDSLEIKCWKNKIVFTCKGDFTDRITEYESKEFSKNEDETILVNICHAHGYNTDAPELVQGIYELKNLASLAKCANLCNELELYMKDGHLMVIKYKIENLGRILLCLSPIRSDSVKNTFEEEEANY